MDMKIWPDNAPPDLDKRWKEALQGLADASGLDYRRQCNVLFMIYLEMESRRVCRDHVWGQWLHNHNGGEHALEHDHRSCTVCGAEERKYTHTKQMTLMERYGTIEVK